MSYVLKSNLSAVKLNNMKFITQNTLTYISVKNWRYNLLTPTSEGVYSEGLVVALLQLGEKGPPPLALLFSTPPPPFGVCGLLEAAKACGGGDK